jgi:hypothetical protein
MAQSTSKPKKRSTGRLACGGCLALLAAGLGLVLCVGGVFAARAFGLFGPDAEDLYSGAPDLVASAAVEEALLAAGVENAQAVVIPIKGSDGQIAVITVDQSTSTASSTPDEAFDQALQGMAAANQSGGHRIERVTLDLRDENGEPGIALTAPQEKVEAYANGEISRQELMGESAVDLSDIIDPATFNQLLEEAQ